MIWKVGNNGMEFILIIVIKPHYNLMTLKYVVTRFDNGQLKRQTITITITIIRACFFIMISIIQFLFWQTITSQSMDPYSVISS